MSPYLRKTIMATLAALALSGVDSPADAAEICVDNSCYYVPDPLPGPGTASPELPDPGELYPDEPGNDSGNDGGSSDPAPAPAPVNAMVCLDLTTRKPHGCSGSYLSWSTLDSPIVPEQWKTLIHWHSKKAREMGWRVTQALNSLSGCYYDFKEPSDCERQFIVSVEVVPIPSGDLSRALFDEGLNEVIDNLQWAASLRESAEWLKIYDVNFSVGVNPGAVSFGAGFNFGAAAAGIASLNDFNKGFYSSRLRHSCNLWNQAWSDAGCSN